MFNNFKNRLIVEVIFPASPLICCFFFTASTACCEGLIGFISLFLYMCYANQMFEALVIYLYGLFFDIFRHCGQSQLMLVKHQLNEYALALMKRVLSRQSFSGPGHLRMWSECLDLSTS